jgi:chemotaxis protein MotB
VADLRAQVAAQPPVQAAAAPRGVIGDDAAARLRAALRGQRGARVEGDRVILGAEVLFQVGQFELQQAGRDALARVAEAIVAVAPQVQAGAPWLVQVEGHTDRQPSRQRTNMELSQLRAMSVARFLAERGVPWERLSVAGFGEHHPIDRGDNDAAHARNRRIELRFATR